MPPSSACDRAISPMGAYHRRAELYDASTRSWSVGPDMLSGRGAHSATLLLDGSVLVAGGYAASYTPPDNWLSLVHVATRSAERLTGMFVPGAPCSSDLDCGGLSCADGVCCGAACDGACEACSIAAGGAEDGVCSPLTGPACDDGNACTQADACQAGACAGAPVGDGAPCDDGNACTQADACQAGACAGAPVGDGSDCTQGDTCDAGACVHETSVVCEPSAPCRVSACDAATGACVESLQPDGTPCDDGDGCTLAETCQAGACVAGAHKTCPVPSSCYAAGACNSWNGICGWPSLLPDGAPCPDPTTAAWIPASPAEGVGNAYSATLLQDGTVLVAGGFVGTSELTYARVHSAVRYDPATDSWTPTGAMIHARAMHRATLLQDGTVLVSGGTEPASGETEIYDPATGVWTAAAPMNQIRERYTATLLANGKVLVAAGQVDGVPTTSTEVYDRATNTWTPGAWMGRSRSSHSAVLLSDGRVLAVGNQDYYDSDGRPELYDPVADTWTYSGHPYLSSRLDRPWATPLANGNVLVIGKSTNGDTSVLLYDPTNDTWTDGPSLPASCVLIYDAELLTDGRVLIIGCHSAISPLGGLSSLLYDPASNTWSLAPPLRIESSAHQLTRLLDERLLLTSCSTTDCTAQIYVPGSVVPGEGACSQGVCMALDGGSGSSSGAGGGGGAAGAGGEHTSSGSGAGGDTTGGGGADAASSSAAAGGGAAGGGTSSGHGGSGASPPGHHSDGGCSLSRSPVGSRTGAPWLLLAALLAARRNAPRRRALRPPVAR
ncbi:hypothetical protein [Sorangium sp. So ce341]|uniref:Kelch repeat-containing protein n=1 Tax=Sorangium sp. So ce341 TaxID=3133302 RepID=UPI003F626939